MWLKQSTAVVISFGPFVDATDGVTLEAGLVTALDHATTGIMLSKNGGTLAVRNATVTASTYDAHGCYKVTLDTTDTATLGSLRAIYTDPTTNLAVWRDFTVVPAAMYNSVHATSGGNLPNAAADGAGGLPISDAGGLDLDARLDAAITSRMATFTLPTNFSALVITAGGAVDSLCQGFLNTLVTETTAGRLSGNFSVILDNADADTTKTADDIGGGSGLDAAGVRTAIGMASANLDTQLSSIDTKQDTAQADLDIITGASGVNLLTATQASIDAIETDTATSIPALIATAQADLDIITGASGVNLLTATQATIDAIPTLAEILAGGDVDGYTIEETLKLCLSALAAKLSGAATGTVVIRAADDSKDRITATTDTAGNRSAVTLDATG